MAPPSNGAVLTDFERHQREVVNTFARAALAMHDAAKVAEEFSNWFARANNIKDIPSPTFNFDTITPSGSDVAVAGKKRKADKETSPSLDQNGKKKRVVKEKKPRDKDAPKRPPSAYLLFQNEIRKGIKSEHPGMTNLEILQEVSKLWNTVSEEEKKTYLQSHSDLKTKYDEDKAAYDAKLGIVPNLDEKRKKEERAKKAKKTTPPPPKGNTLATTVRANTGVIDDSDEGSPKEEEEEDEPEQEEGSQPDIEITEEDEEEDENEDEDEIDDSEVESESEPPKKKAKAESKSRKSPPAAKGKDKEKKSTKARYHDEEKKKKRH